MRIIVISLIFVSIGIKPVVATEIRWGCSTTMISNIAAVGDSRADQLSGFGAAGFNNNIQNAKFNGKNIFPDNTVLLQGLAQFGSMAKDYAKKIKLCQESTRVAFDVPQYSIVHLGGNDLMDYIKRKNDMKHVSDADKIGNEFKDFFKNIYNAGQSFYRQVRKTSLRGFLRSPFRTISNLAKSWVNFVTSPFQNLTGNPLIKYPDYQAQWEWQDATETDRVVTDMKFILSHFMEQSGTANVNGITINTPKSVLLNTVPIPAPASFGYAIATGTKDFRWYYTNVVKLFNGLRTKYTKDLFVNLRAKYGLQIILLDTYNHFLHNVLRQNSSQYIDGIHFTEGEDIKNDKGVIIGHKEGGNEYWGRAIALTMSYHKWLTLDNPLGVQQLYVDIDVGAASATINTSAKAAGIDATMVEMTDIDSHNHGFSKYFEQEPIIIEYMGYDYDFDNDKSYYVRNGDNRAYMVRGDIRTMYEGNGGPDGQLGFPIQDEVTGSIFESYRSQNFECGTIIKNYFDLITPQKIIMNETTPECIAKKARDKN
jgi:hypothetical protein